MSACGHDGRARTSDPASRRALVYAVGYVACGPVVADPFLVFLAVIPLA